MLSALIEDLYERGLDKKSFLKTRYDNGTAMYNSADPKQSIFMVRPGEWVGIPTMKPTKTIEYEILRQSRHHGYCNAAVK